MKALLLPLLLLGATACDAQAPKGRAEAPPPTVRFLAETPLPALTGRVVDRADMIAAPAEAELVASLAALEKETSDQLVVVTVEGLNGEAIGDLGLRLGNGWGIGRKGVGNGVLLIFAPADRQARIEVGKGLEGLLTDARAKDIMDRAILPQCRAGRCDRAAAAGVAAIAGVLRSDPVRPRRKAGSA